MFVDPMFPPCTASLSVNEDDGLQDVVWVRASELHSDPQMFVDGASRFDIKQGALGDCWLLAAMANLTLSDPLFHQVVPHDQTFQDLYAGIFHFRIWQYGEWVDVVVDDYLPTRNGSLMYIKSAAENEYWSALLEKAYAKIHGSYGALKGGSTAEAMVDFTGGCSESYDLDDQSKWMAIYQIMYKGSKMNSMMACHLLPDPNILEAKTNMGLIRGHAYSVTKVVKALVDTGNKSGAMPLVRVRNPWGDATEWKGSWCDGSAVWTFVSEEEKERIGLNFEHDGEFYMSQQDFMTNFDAVEICNLSPDIEGISSIRSWNVQHLEGSWIEDCTAGGCRNYLDTFAMNPQYVMTLEDSDEDDDDHCTCVISLLQKGTRKKRVVTNGSGCLTIGFTIYKLNDVTLPLETEFFRYTLSAGQIRHIHQFKRSFSEIHL